MPGAGCEVRGAVFGFRYSAFGVRFSRFGSQETGALNSLMKIHWNDECRLSNGGFASLSLFYKMDRMHYSMLDV